MFFNNTYSHRGEWSHVQNIPTDHKRVFVDIDLRGPYSELPLLQTEWLTLAVFIWLFNEELAT